MSRARGFALALGSVALVSGAQLGMRWSMTRLPLPTEWLTALNTGAIDLGALKHLPLGRAYSLLSISYALVYVLAASLPVFNEAFSLSKTLGVALVILGVLIINSRRASTTRPRNAP